MHADAANLGRVRDPTTEEDRPDTVDVVVVGAGPAGLVAGIVLGGYGIDVAVLEKRAQGSTLSRATVISTRCMEILRSWGLEPDVRAGAADVVPRAWVTPSLLSGEGVEMPLGYPTTEEAAAVSPTSPAWAPQDHLEPLLRAYLSGLPSARLWFGAQVEDAQQDDDGVTVSVRLAQHNDSGPTPIRARYMIGADGAHSTTRATTQISMDGPDDLAEFHRIEFRAPLEHLLGERRFGLYVITNPDAAGMLVTRGPGDRWGFAREWRPGEARMVDTDEDELVELLTRAIGIRTPLALEHRSAFSFAAQIAQTYRKGRIFLVGDAAHRMAPRGGTGMNTAIQDAYDVGWRLAWVLNGWATSELLDSYEVVRRPVAVHHVQRAGEPGGARQDAEAALPWDFNDRVAHQWIESDGRVISTLDLVSDGLTLLAGSDEPRWASINLETRAPQVAHSVNARDAIALGIPTTGARLLGPDARDIAAWANFDDYPDNAKPVTWLE